MSEPDIEPSNPSNPSDRRRAMRAFLITLLLGPPVGGLVFLVPMLIGSLFDTGEEVGLWFAGTAKLALAIFLMSYLMGGLSALIAATVLAWRIAKRGTVGIGFVLLDAMASGFVGIILIDRLVGIEGAKPKPLEAALGLGILCAFVALIAAILLLPVAARAGILKRAVKPQL